MLPVIQIGPLAIQTPGLVILLGFWIGLTLAEKLAPRFGLKPDHLYNGVGLATLAGLLGARLSFIFLHLSIFIDEPWSVFSLNTQLLDVWGGLVTGILVLLIYIQRKELNLFAYLDALTPLLAVLQIALPTANLASGRGYGVPTSLPWAIELWGASRHPIQVYEILAGISVLAFVWANSRSANTGSPGRLFLMFLALSAGTRVFLESFRADRTFLLSRFRRTQIAAWIVLLISLILLGIQPKHSPQPQNSS
ncbi:MAG: prolipoprotein diacylglyceryl transferase [Anaerolineales bacterium]|jgi:phosphatidylglycerol:prolipoprotein diacylglycerol transferase